MMDNNNLIVITGAARGIGAVFADYLVKAGARVVIGGRDKKKVEETASEIGKNAFPVVFDVTKNNEVREAFDYIEQQYGPVSTLINNAGVLGPVDRFNHINPDEWNEVVEVNLKGTVNCTSAALKYMVPRDKGQIINLTSHAGIFRWPGCSSYSVTKAAIIKLTENLAIELGSHNISLFAYHPGVVHSIGMSEQAINEPAIPGSVRSEAVAWFLNEKKAGRTVDPHLGAEGIVKLCSGKYGKLSGRYLTVYDNLDTLVGRADEIRNQDLLTLRLATASLSNHRS